MKKVLIAAGLLLLAGAGIAWSQFGTNYGSTPWSWIDLDAAGTCGPSRTNAIRLCGSGGALAVSIGTAAPFTLISSGGAIATGLVDYAQLATDTLQYAPFTLTNAQIKALNTTPISVVSAQGSGTLIEVVSAVLENVFVTPAFANGGAIGFSYGAMASVAASSTAAATFLTSPVANQTIVLTGSLASNLSSAVLNQPIVISAASADFITGNGSIKGKLVYRVHTGL